MPWEAVRNRYLAAYDQSGADVAWHLIVGHYVADRWLAEDKLLQGQPYDPALTDGLWDQLTIAEVEKLEKQAADSLEALMLAKHRAIDRAALTEVLKTSDKMDGGWLVKTALEGVVGALGVIIFGLVVLLLTAPILQESRSALSNLFGPVAAALSQTDVNKTG